MFQNVSNRNAGFTLFERLTFVLKRPKQTSHKTLKNLLIMAGLLPFLFTKPATAQVITAVPHIAAVPSATQMPTDEATKKRIEGLIAQLGDKRASVRISAADALGKIGQPAIQPLIKALEDENYHVRFAAARGLGETGNPKAVQPLVKALEDEDWLVRDVAARALGKIGDPQAVEALIKALDDESGSVSAAAAWALGKIDDPQAAQAVRKRALAHKAKAVLSVVIPVVIGLVALCSPILIVVGVVSLLSKSQRQNVVQIEKSQRQSVARIEKPIRHKTETGSKAIRAVLIYLALVTGNVLCPPILVLLGFTLCGLLGLLGFYWLAITSGGFLVLLSAVQHPDLALYFLISGAYFSIFFLPLFGALYFKDTTAKKRCKVVQVLFIICHIVVHFILIAQYDLLNRMVECIRY